MKTGGDFKRAGLVFVNFDEGEGYIIHEANSFNEDDYLDDRIPTSFAWRDNTGVKPEFNGAIDAIIGEGDDIEEIDYEL